MGGYMFTDSHCHIFNEYYTDIAEILKKAEESKVDKFIVAATDIKSSVEVLNLAKEYKNIYICLGIHPDSIDNSLDEFEKILVENVDNEKLVAIGEIGLDYYYGKDTRDMQIKYFEYQLSLAEKYDLPVVVHSRDATKDTIDCLKKYRVTGVIHCFTGSLDTAKIYMKMGFYIGVNGVMTFKKAKIDEVIKEIPLEKLVLETDSPYLTPEPYRKYKNQPAYIYTIAQYLANLKGVSLEEISRITEKNIKDIFDI